MWSYGTMSKKVYEVLKKQAANITVEAHLPGLCGANSQGKEYSAFPPLNTLLLDVPVCLFLVGPETSALTEF